MSQDNSGNDPAETQIADVIEQADKALSIAILAALQEARNLAAEGMSAIGKEGAAPALEYFAAVVHQRMYCLMCGGIRTPWREATPILHTTSSATARTLPSVTGRLTLTFTRREKVRSVGRRLPAQQ
ncbi:MULTISPECIES: hypothetical protein [Rhizobium]|uniref:hypothetical protein n=1 Tax=Rhizobium phaseoli TaxID=396 RepID=UPI000190434D|nr:hypothetical protein [Rhizobium phaseoli]